MRMSKKLLGTIKNATNALTDLIQEYSAIGTPDECRAAMEKQIPKKPIDKTHPDNVCARIYENFDIIVCPTCGKRLKLKSKGKYCDKCGQRLEW